MHEVGSKVSIFSEVGPTDLHAPYFVATPLVMPGYIGQFFQKNAQNQGRGVGAGDTGNMLVPYNSPGGYLVHILFPQFAFFRFTALGGLPENPGYSEFTEVSFTLFLFRIS